MVEVRVEFDYDAELPDELTLRVGDIITDVKQMEGGWWQGTLKGKAGVFPDNFVKVISRSGAGGVKKPSSASSTTSSFLSQKKSSLGNLSSDNNDENDLSAANTTSSSNNLDEDTSVQLRSKGLGGKQHCKVLFSYTPTHEDELELKQDDVIEFQGEVEDGWWRGQLRGRVGVFPSNFVEMLTTPPAHVTGNTATTQSAKSLVEAKNTALSEVAAENKKNNENLKEHKPSSNGVASKISSLIQEVEAKSKKKSVENLPQTAANSQRRQSPLGGEDHSQQTNRNSLSDGPKLPPKPARGSSASSSLSGGSSSSPVGRKYMGHAPFMKKSSGLRTARNVKEQCEVLFPYKALNEDELSLKEGQIITIVTKDVEDQGWWKGEVDGKVGVFPDNFVRLLEAKQEEPSVPAASKPLGKKPHRPPNPGLSDKSEATKASKASTKPTIGSHSFRRGSASSNDSRGSSAAASKERLSGSQNNSSENVAAPATSRVANRVSVFSGSTPKKATAPGTSSTSSSSTGGFVSNAKKHSFGKGTPPPKPKPPAPSKPTSEVSTPPATTAAAAAATPGKLAGSKFGLKSVSASNVPSSDKDKAAMDAPRMSLPTPQSSVDVIDLDSVGGHTEKLSHPTATRAKAPKRRPPSSVFMKDAKSSDDSSDRLQGDIPEESGSTSSREASQEVSLGNRLRVSSEQLNKSTDSLKSSENSDLTSLTKSRLSFKKNIKDLFGLANGDSKAKDEKEAPPTTTAASKKPPPPRPPVSSSAGGQTDFILPKAEEPKKPDWLQELKRNQQNRKSGLFQQQQSQDEEVKKSSPEATLGSPSTPTPPPTVPSSTTTSTGHDSKPVLPTKPSQIKEEVRKSVHLPLTNPKPSSLGTTSSSFRRQTVLDSTKTSKAFDTAKSPTSDAKPESIASPVSGSAKAIAVANERLISPKKERNNVLDLDKSTLENMSLEERVRRLEKLVVEMQHGFDRDLSRLGQELSEEREARKKLEEELASLKTQ